MLTEIALMCLFYPDFGSWMKGIESFLVFDIVESLSHGMWESTLRKLGDGYQIDFAVASDIVLFEIWLNCFIVFNAQALHFAWVSSRYFEWTETALELTTFSLAKHFTGL